MYYSLFVSLQYDPFSTPRLKAEVVRLSNQLTEARLNLGTVNLQYFRIYIAKHWNHLPNSCL